MILEEADRQEEGLFRRGLDEVRGGGMRLVALRRQDMIVTDFLGAAMDLRAGQMLNASQRRHVTGGFKRVNDMLAEIPQNEVAVGQTQQPALCGDWPVKSAARLGEQVGAAQ